MKNTRLALLLAAAMLAAHPAAHAGLIEELLALPAIQSLLGRIPELDPLVKRCEDVAYRQRNQETCQQAVQAAELAKMPSELRAVMSTPKAAASLRQLCLAVVGQPAQGSYLCAELAKHDTSFNDKVRLQQWHNRLYDGHGR